MREMMTTLQIYCIQFDRLEVKMRPPFCTNCTTTTY